MYKAESLTDHAASKAAALTEERLGRRIDARADSYKQTHEKQYEVESLERRVNALENRTA